MLFDAQNLRKIHDELKPYSATLVAVSKTKPVDAIRAVYETGHRVFGENYVQELLDKVPQLPDDVQWHFIGHLQSNKVRQIAPFITLIHGVDSFNLLKEINKQGEKNRRIINCLLQIHIAQEETKFGLSIGEAEALIARPEFHQMKNVCVKGLMGMATLTTDRKQLRNEFQVLASFYQDLRSRVYTARKLNGKKPPLLVPSTEEMVATKEPVMQPSNLQPEILSMGMSSDYRVALLEGSNMVRIGSLIFGER